MRSVEAAGLKETHCYGPARGDESRECGTICSRGTPAEPGDNAEVFCVVATWVFVEAEDEGVTGAITGDILQDLVALCSSASHDERFEERFSLLEVGSFAG